MWEKWFNGLIMIFLFKKLNAMKLYERKILKIETKKGTEKDRKKDK